MSAHTPGPWALGWKGEGYEGVSGPSSSPLVWLDGKDEDYAIVSARDGGHTFGETVCALFGERKEANARLIAAAPDLLAALKAYRAACEEQDIKLGPISGDADAAIAKAEGRGA